MIGLIKWYFIIGMAVTVLGFVTREDGFDEFKERYNKADAIVKVLSLLVIIVIWPFTLKLILFDQ